MCLTENSTEQCGFIRRGKESSGDVDMLVLTKKAELRPDVVINMLVAAIKERTQVFKISPQLGCLVH